MTRKIYRTAQGKMVDLGALQLRNENVRAVGNMGVNARGDLVDGFNRPIDTRNQQVAKQYKKQVTEQPAEPARTKSAAVSPTKTTKPAPAPSQASKHSRELAPDPVVIPPPPEDFEDEFTKDTVGSTGPAPATGLAAAIARARQIKQEPLKTPRQAAQDSDGVRKL
jgi:hypothetical protein